MHLSQSALAARLGVTFQAVQKYEGGTVRISASRLYEVARALEITPAYFFEGYDDAAAAEGDDDRRSSGATWRRSSRAMRASAIRSSRPICAASSRRSARPRSRGCAPLSRTL